MHCSYILFLAFVCSASSSLCETTSCEISLLHSQSELEAIDISVSLKQSSFLRKHSLRSKSVREVHANRVAARARQDEYATQEPTLNPSVVTAVEAMNAEPDNLAVQMAGCEALGEVDSSSVDIQNQAASAGVIEAAANAMQRFPENKYLITACTGGVSSSLLFHQENGLRAGSLGILNLTFATYAANMDDPAVTSMGGSIGCFFDFVNENRAIARELGGIQLIIQNIKNNFHGQYSDWAYDPVLQSLYALSSGCWTNEDICVDEGFSELAIQLVHEHGTETKIAEETFQATKAIMSHPDDSYRQHLAQIGFADALVYAMQTRTSDQGQQDLACDNMGVFIGPYMAPTFREEIAQNAFDPEIQALATEAGAVAQILHTLMEVGGMTQYAHEGFNTDLDANYNYNADCMRALTSLATDNEANRNIMLQAGLAPFIVQTIQNTSGTTSAGPAIQSSGCSALMMLDSYDLTVCPAVGTVT